VLTGNLFEENENSQGPFLKADVAGIVVSVAVMYAWAFKWRHRDFVKRWLHTNDFAIFLVLMPGCARAQTC